MLFSVHCLLNVRLPFNTVRLFRSTIILEITAMEKMMTNRSGK